MNAERVRFVLPIEDKAVLDDIHALCRAMQAELRATPVTHAQMVDKISALLDTIERDYSPAWAAQAREHFKRLQSH
jgi:hypothetical protein